MIPPSHAGEFGLVYRARLLGKIDSGDEVAVKTLKGCE